MSTVQSLVTHFFAGLGVVFLLDTIIKVVQWKLRKW